MNLAKRWKHLAASLLALLALPAGAAFHLFSFSQVYSNASGTVQYVELIADQGGQQFTTGHTLVSTDGMTTRTYTITTNLPGDTTNRRMLFGTAGVQQAFGVVPDYVIPNGFLHTSAATINWAEGSKVWVHPAIPTNGVALNVDGSTGTPSPQNFAGIVGIAPPPAVVRTQILTGLFLPTDIRFAPGVTDRMFITEKNGLIRIAVGSVINATPFLDLTGIVSTDGERGLLALAFHPDYSNNRAFYVYYTDNTANSAVTVARYLRHPTNPDIADPTSGVALLSIPHSGASNHNGGGFAFGPDGLLYVATGDGGGGGDPYRTGQSISTRLGKVLRIAVPADGGTGYTIPAGNMFPAGGTCATTGCPETWHMGVRNPFRLSFDKLTGVLYIGDVGQNEFEEIDRFLPGAAPTNLGWGIFEGNSCFNDTYFGPPNACANLQNHTRPVHTYSHASLGGTAGSVTGGYVYRGYNIVGLGGFYLFGDYSVSRMWAGRMSGTGLANFSLAPLTFPDISTFGEDAAGELFGADVRNGGLYRFGPAAGAPDPALDADSDGVPSGVEGQEGIDPFVKDNDIFASNRLFAMQQYRDFLGREGDAGGIGFFVNLLNTGAAVRANVIESFFFSPEFSGFVSPVARLYFATFLRIPDYPGLIFQTNAFRTGTPLEVIANNFTLSPEFQATYGSLDDPSFVTLLYQNILGRTPSQGEIDFHVARLTSGVTRGAVLVGFSESPEYQQASLIDVYVTMMYVGMLRRAPEQAGFDFWKAYMQGGNSGLALILGFLNAPEYRNRFLPP